MNGPKRMLNLLFRSTALFWLTAWIAYFPFSLSAAEHKATPASGTPDSTGVELSRAGQITASSLKEISGLAASRLNPEILWVINDGGDGAVLYALDTKGQQLGRVRILKAVNRDWEDLASFVLDGSEYLLIADVGDNSGRRKFCTLYVIKEPVIDRSTSAFRKTATIAWQIRFQYEDGPRDCESVAVDVVNRRILLISKRDIPVSLYELPLEPDQPGTEHIARRLTPIYNLTLPTGFDLSPDQSSAVILNYRRSYYYERRDDESWEKTLTREPQAIEFPSLKQQEAICFSADGKAIYITSEGIPAPLLRIDLQK